MKSWPRSAHRNSTCPAAVGAYLTIAAQQHLPPAGQPPRKPPATSGSTGGGGAAFPAGSSPVWSATSAQVSGWPCRSGNHGSFGKKNLNYPERTVVPRHRPVRQSRGDAAASLVSH
jgi:hypothetical protein